MAGFCPGGERKLKKDQRLVDVSNDLSLATLTDIQTGTCSGLWTVERVGRNIWLVLWMLCKVPDQTIRQCSSHILSTSSTRAPIDRN
jgi:hypothetical protein